MSDRITLQHCKSNRLEEAKPLDWVITGERFPDDLRVVVTKCGGCGRDQTIGQKHSIDRQGVVNPSYVCAFNCGWHVWVQLADWTHGEKPLGSLEVPRG